MEKVVLILLAAAVGESINEFLFMPFFDYFLGKAPETIRVQTMRLWSALMGVGIAMEFCLDLFGLLGVQAVHAQVGVILTGILLGRGSNWVHDFINKFVSNKQ